MNPECPNCKSELSICREMFLRDIIYHYVCYNCSKRFMDDWRIYSEERLKIRFEETYCLNFEI
jgi:transposase-like protein